MARELVAIRFPHFDWYVVRSSWSLLPINDRFIALTARRLQLTNNANAIIAREALSGVDTNMELVFKPCSYGSTIKRIQMRYPKLFEGNELNG